MSLLTRGNRDLRRDGIYTWSLPAFVVDLPHGTWTLPPEIAHKAKFNVCPSAGKCAPLCYARKGTYRFRNVREAHMRNLRMVMEDIEGWEAAMTDEVAKPKYADAHVRIHDGGDFFSRAYLLAWLRIARSAPLTTFYCYTKEVLLFREVVEPDPPDNFRWVYSRGGRWDHLIRDTDRQADVFPDEESLQAAGYHDQGDSDLLAIYGPPKVGIVVNNHPGAVTAMRGTSFGGA